MSKLIRKLPCGRYYWLKRASRRSGQFDVYSDVRMPNGRLAYIGRTSLHVDAALLAKIYYRGHDAASEIFPDPEADAAEADAFALVFKSGIEIPLKPLSSKKRKLPLS